MPALSAYLAEPLDEDSGAAVAKALGAIGHPSARDRAHGGARLVAGGRARAGGGVVARSARAEGRQGRRDRRRRCLPLVADADPNVRRQAIMTDRLHRASRAATSPARSRRSSSAATGDPSAAVRKAAAWALGELKDGSARAALQQAQANDTDPLVRSIATAALANSAVNRHAMIRRSSPL